MLSLSSTGMKKAEPALLSLRDPPDTETDSYHMSFHAVTLSDIISTSCQLQSHNLSINEKTMIANQNASAQ